MGRGRGDAGAKTVRLKRVTVATANTVTAGVLCVARGVFLVNVDAVQKKMGVAYSSEGPLPPYARSVEARTNYDYWGYIPNNFKPSQHVWHTYFSDTLGGAELNFPRQGDTREGWQRLGFADSLAASILRPKFDGPDRAFQGGGWVQDIYPVDPLPGIDQQPKTEAWTEQWIQQQASTSLPYEPTALCNPLNFPNCTMKPFKEGEGIFHDYVGRQYSTMDIWHTKIDELYESFYVNGNVDALDTINPEVTSGYDPCVSEGFLAFALPTILGIITGTAFQRLFSTDLRATLTTTTMNIWSVGSVGFGFFWMRSAMDVYGPEEENRAISAMCLTLPASLSIAEVIINQGTVNAQPNTIYAMCVIAGYYLVNPVLKSVLAGPQLVNFIIHFVTGVLNIAGTFVCRVLSEQPDACAHVNDQIPFANARRWDAASIAAKLTDEIRAQEGWSRDDPRSEFAFKAFLTGPAIVDAARGTDPSVTPMWTHGLGNPLGSIYAPEPNQMFLEGFNFMHYSLGTIYGFDGNQSGFQDVANSNLFSCQNWDVLRHALPAKQGAAATPEQQQVADRFDLWVKAVKDAALVPANLVQAGIGRETSGIPGWKGGTDTWEPLRAVWSSEQWLQFIDNIYRSLTPLERYQAVHAWPDTHMAPSDPAITLWLEANDVIYTFIVLKTDKTAADVWTYISNDSRFTQTPEQLSAVLYAAAATTGSNDLRAFWDTAPVPMIAAAVAYNPPQTRTGITLPFGWPDALNDPKYHQHRSTPLQPKPGDSNLCGVNLSTIRNPPPNKQNASLPELLNMVTNLLRSEQVCQTCSIQQVATLFCYKLMLEASQLPDAGLGYVVQELLSLGWSDRNMAAAMWELSRRITGQADLESYYPVFLMKRTWKGVDYDQRINDWLNMPLNDFDDNVKLCDNVIGPVTPLRPIRSAPPPILKILPPPEHQIPGPIKTVPVDHPGSPCAAALQTIQNPVAPGDYNLPLSELQKDAQQGLALKACNTCSVSQIATLFAYNLLLENATDVIPEGAGKLCHQLSVVFKFSSNSMSAVLLNLKTPLQNQSYLSQYMDQFWSLTSYDFYDWSVEIEDWLSVDGYFDASADLCNVNVGGNDPTHWKWGLDPIIVSKPIGFQRPPGHMTINPNFPAQCNQLLNYLQNGSSAGSLPANADVDQIYVLLANLFMTPNREYCKLCDISTLGPLTTWYLALSTRQNPSIGEWMMTCSTYLNWDNASLSAGLHTLSQQPVNQTPLLAFLSDFTRNTKDQNGKDWGLEILTLSGSSGAYNPYILQGSPAGCASAQ